MAAVLGVKPATLALKTRVHRDGTETEKRLAGLLFDDAVQVLSSFELNQIASLSYGDEPCDEIFELLTEVMATAAEHSVLCVQKSLVISRHILIYGSEKTVNSAWGLRTHVEHLKEFNTVLQKKGVGAWWQNVKGGAVDQGFPVREAATKLDELLHDETKLRAMRNDKADPNSLVPIGDDRVAFVSDEVRLFMLKKRMEEQSRMKIKSNLAKATGGFGAGYASKDGKSIVGAAHSIDEMVARAEREKKKFTDEGPVHYKPPKTKTEAAAGAVDLLDFGAPAASTAPQAEVDLLGFDGAAAAVEAAPAAPALDVFAPQQQQNQDLLGANATPEPQSTTSVNGTADALSLLSVVPLTTEPTPSNPLPEPGGGDKLTEPTVPAKQSVMASNADRFAALDALELPGAGQAGSILSAKEAENRILSHSSDRDSTTGTKPVPSEPPLADDGGVMGGEAMGGTASASVGAVMGGMSMTSMMNGLGGAPPESTPPQLPAEPPPPPPLPVVEEPITIGMAPQYGDAPDNDNDDGFVMGGASGTGYGEPTVAMPSAPPPPPPPS